MTGSNFKSLMQKRHGFKWAKGAAKDLGVTRFTCQHLANMAKIPEKYEKLVGKLK
jgi:hypothetical protein